MLVSLWFGVFYSITNWHIHLVVQKRRVAAKKQFPKSSNTHNTELVSANDYARFILSTMKFKSHLTLHLTKQGNTI